MIRYLALLLLIPLNTLLAVDHPEFLKELNIEQIQFQMDQDECYIAYRDQDALIITKDEIKTFTVNLEEMQRSMEVITREVTQFEKSPFSHNPEIFLQNVKSLYDLLVLPVSHHLKMRVNVLPSAAYDMIPWNALMDQYGSFLIDQHEISLKQTLDSNLGRQFARKTLKVLIVAPIFRGSLRLSGDLEQEEISRLLPSQASNWETSDILHISSHGRVDTTDWLESGILISDESVLSNEEISSMCLDTELVFLNMCESAKRWKHGKSIVDAFGDAGAKSTIGALWQVNDQFAVQLSENFYNELIKGKRSGEALRNSILRYKENCELQSDLHPLKWSGYQLYGESSKVVAYQSFGFKRILSVILSIFTGFSLISYYFGNLILERVRIYEFS